MINFGKISSMNNQSFLFKGKVMLSIVLLLAPVVNAAAQDAIPLPHPDDQQLYIGDTIAIAQTEYGKVQGFKDRERAIILRLTARTYQRERSTKTRAWQETTFP